MNASDQNIICIILPSSHGTQQSNKELLDNTSISTGNESNGHINSILDFIKVKMHSEYEEKAVATMVNSNEIKSNVSRNPKIGKPQQVMKSSKTSDSKVKRKSKYSDIYNSGDIEFIRKDPKYSKSKTLTRHQNNTLERPGTSSSYKDNQTFKQSLRSQEGECQGKSSQHSLKMDKKKCDKPPSEYEPSLKMPKNTNAHDEDEDDLKLVHKLIDMMKYPKTKHHQYCAIDILRHNQKFLKIFQRERQAFGRLKVPVFRKPDKYRQSETALGSTAAKEMSMQDIHQKNDDDVATIQTLPLPLSTQKSSPTSNLIQIHEDGGSGMEYPSANGMLSTTDAYAVSMSSLDAIPINLDDLWMDSTSYIQAFLQNDSPCDQHNRTNTHSKE